MTYLISDNDQKNMSWQNTMNLKRNDKNNSMGKEKAFLAQLQLDKKRLYSTQVNQQHTLPAALMPPMADIPVCKTMRCLKLYFCPFMMILTSLTAYSLLLRIKLSCLRLLCFYQPWLKQCKLI